MKKKGVIITEYKYPIHLFREELLVIEAILKEDLNGRDFKVSFDDFESEDISSILINQKSSNNLSFHTYNPYFSLDIGQYSSRFFVTEDSLQIRGAIEKIKEIFLKNTKIGSRIREPVANGMLFLACASLLFMSINPNYYFSNKIEIYKVGFLAFLCFISFWQLSSPLKPIIEFEFRNNRKNFWERHREQIYVGFIVGIPVAMISFLLGLLF